MKKNTSATGFSGEQMAKKYLEKYDYTILATNFFNKTGKRLGEIDIIAKKNNEIIFIEVKTRIKKDYFLSIPEENITKQKLFKLNKIAQYYLRTNNPLNYSYRFDAISIIFDLNKKTYSLKHLRNIFL